MNRLVPVQSWLPQEAADQVRSHCQKNCMPVSEFIRTLVLEACASGLAANRIERHLEWISADLNFAAVALDALLAGHADPDLRSRVHEAFARKGDRRRSAMEGVEGAGQ